MGQGAESQGPPSLAESLHPGPGFGIAADGSAVCSIKPSVVIFSFKSVCESDEGLAPAGCATVCSKGLPLAEWEGSQFSRKCLSS